MLDYKVSYKKEWDKEGTTYRQTITILFPNKETLDKINLAIKDCKENSGNWMNFTYLKELNIGKNYTKLTTADFIVTNYLNPDDMRIKRDRNSIINVKIKK